jgi:hypothetical protein
MIAYISYTIEMADMLLSISALQSTPTTLSEHNQRLQRTVYVICLRVHKLITVLMKLFPTAMELVKSSLFDKNFILNSILNASSLTEHEAWAEYLMVTPYSNETNKLLADGGISKKTVK